MKATIQYFTRYVKLSILLRLLFGPVIFISPFIATIANFILDGFDGEIFKRSGYARPQYSIYDKILDYYWYIWIILFIFITNVPAKYVFLSLFLYRSIGQFLFVLYNKGIILFLFPNIFEKVFCYYLFSLLIHREHQLMSPPYFPIAVFVITCISVLVEYVIHIRKANLSGLYLGKTSYWPVKTINPYKAFIVFILVLSFGVLLNQFVANKTMESYTTKAAKATKSGKILTYDPKGVITGIFFDKNYQFIDVFVFSLFEFQIPLCSAKKIPITKIEYPLSDGNGHAYSFSYTDGCLSSLSDGSYSLLAVPSDRRDNGNLIQFTVRNGSLTL
jgi:hypothetical protein